jgi:hypothetical protein
MDEECGCVNIEGPVKNSKFEYSSHGPLVYVRNEDGSIPILIRQGDGTLKKSNWYGEFSYSLLEGMNCNVVKYEDDIPVLECEEPSF